jgi:hypothetical protein
MLIDQMEYLYYPLIRADQRPGSEALKRFNKLKNRLKEIEDTWQQLEEDMDKMNEGN